jgi:hypothetical protein
MRMIDSEWNDELFAHLHLIPATCESGWIFALRKRLARTVMACASLRTCRVLYSAAYKPRSRRT